MNLLRKRTHGSNGKFSPFLARLDSATQGGREGAEFLLKFSVREDGLRQFLPHQCAEALAHSTHGHFRSAFSHAKPLRCLCKGQITTIPCQENLEHVEKRGAARKRELLTEPTQGMIQHRQRPSAVVGRIWCLRTGGLHAVTAL